MRTVLRRWGDGLGVRLPKRLTEDAGFRAGDVVDVGLQEGAVVIRRSHPRYSLEQLIEGMSQGSTHVEFDFGGPMGREII